MKEWSGTINQPEYAAAGIARAAEYAPLSTLLLFDIETTGFSPMNSYCYMIGFCYIRNSVWHYRMLFNDDGRSEYAILQEFLQVLKDYQLLIHYNGDRFDIPFLNEKIRQYQALGLPLGNASGICKLQSLDLYKFIKPFRKGLNLQNLKLSTLEKAMGYHRSDMYNGGELIHIYKQYLESNSSDLEQHLYQHNYEDILAMIPMLQLLNYGALADTGNSPLQITALYEDEHSSGIPSCIILELSLSAPLPLPYQIEIQGIQIHCEQQYGRIIIPLFQAELKFYIPNWQDYYYLPIEDQIIHKSLATYVDSEYKQKAKKNQCFLKKKGCFLPIPDRILSNNYDAESPKIYQETPQSKTHYIEYEDRLLKDQSFFLSYVQALLS